MNILVTRPEWCFCLGMLTSLCLVGELISSQEVFVFFRREEKDLFFFTEWRREGERKAQGASGGGRFHFWKDIQM